MIAIKDFSGLRLNADPMDIPDNASQLCTDVDFSRAILQGLPSNVEATTAMPSQVRGALIYSDTAGVERAYVWPYAVHAVQSPVQQDDHKRFYWTGHNGTANEFKFGRVADNTGNAVTSSYKVGVINSTVWDNTPETLGVSFDTAPVEPSVAMSELSNSDLKLWLCDPNGALVKDVSSTVVSFTGQGTPTNGWYRTYRLVTSATLASHAEKTVSTVKYRSEEHTLVIGGVTVDKAAVWYDGATPKYIVLKNGITYVGLAAQPHVSTVRKEVVNNGYTTSEQYVFTELGRFYFQSNSTLSYDNSAIPGTLSTVTAGDTTIPANYSYAVVWDVTYNDQSHKVTFYVDKSMSGSLDLGTGVTGALTEINTTTYDLNLTFGAQLGYETRAYILTVVNNLGEESEPSLPVEMTLRPGSENVRIKVDTTVLLTNINSSGLVTGRYPLHGFRVYRSVGGDYFYVGTLKGSAVTGIGGENYLSYTTNGSTMLFVDDVSGAALGDACSTVEYISDAAELQNLQGLCRVYNGILAAFKDNEVWLSEPYMPWAWKRKNVVSLPYRVVAIAPYEQGLLVMTELKTYYMGGQQPSDFVPSALAGEYPCLGSRAVASVNNDVVYLSTDGPVIVSGASQRLDQTVAGRDGWRDLVSDVVAGGSDVKLVSFGSRLLMYWGSAWTAISGNPSWGIVLNIETGQWTHVTTPITFATHLPANSFALTSDALAYSHTDQKFWLFAANVDSRQNWVWHSKDFTAPWPLNYGVMQLFGTGSIRVQVYADDVLKTTQDVTVTEAGGIIRLPSGFRAVRWSFKFTALAANAKLRRVYIAVSPTELKNVV